MRNIKVAVIGAGVMGERHIKEYLDNPCTTLEYAVDIDKTRLNYLAKKYDIKLTTSINRVVNHVDAVSIVTPTSTHYELAKFFLINGIHVLLEKPMTDNINDAKNLSLLVDNQNVVLAIGHIERFNPVISDAEKHFKKRQPLFIDIQREGPFNPRIYDTDVFMDLMIHDIDLLYYLLKENLLLKSAYAIQYHTALNDLGNVQLQSTSGTLINITSSRTTYQTKRIWQLVYPDKYIEIDLIGQKIECVHQERNKSTVKKYDTYEMPLKLEINNFVNSIVKGIVPKTSEADGLRAVDLINKIQTSISAGTKLMKNQIV